ncbi:MAG: DNA-3-methyladenine glycosylase [Candidatus Aenigmarchaeota archaeon]|nr:DNA-3-methyladenine glycosylase [Candidatus Aenigmarchaeota archaeon]
MKLSRKFYSRNTKIVAKELLGKILIHRKCKGKIVETEAYFGKDDPASHAYCKITKRNIIMYKKPGTAYVYFTYGNYWMFNVVTEKKGIPGAVLIRALEPLKGIEIMKRRRKLKDIKNLTNGPGKLTKALGIEKKHNCLDLTKSNLFIKDSNEKFEIVNTTRIGLSRGQEKLLRFYIKNNDFVSKK